MITILLAAAVILSYVSGLYIGRHWDDYMSE